MNNAPLVDVHTGKKYQEVNDATYHLAETQYNDQAGSSARLRANRPTSYRSYVLASNKKLREAIKRMIKAEADLGVDDEVCKDLLKQVDESEKNLPYDGSGKFWVR